MSVRYLRLIDQVRKNERPTGWPTLQNYELPLALLVTAYVAKPASSIVIFI